jgi:glycogen debranching enzyme
MHPDCVSSQDLSAEAWRIAQSNIIENPNTPAKRYMKEGFDQEYIYFWDTCFMAEYAKYAPEILPGIESLDNFYAAQSDDGYIPRCYNLATHKEPGFAGKFGNCNPPLAAWVELDYVRQTGNVDRILSVLPHLIALDHWFSTTQRRLDGTWFFAEGPASGMDNSPRTARRNKFGNDVGWVDLAAQAAYAAECISKLALLVNDDKIAAEFREKYAERIDFLNKRHWCERIGFYLDLLLQGLEYENYRAYFSAAKTVVSFWPMLAGACDKHQVKCLVEHLKNPAEFNTVHPIPSISVDNPNYSPDGMYAMGGVWAMTNYMVVRGLMRCGQYALARDISMRHIDMMARVFREVEPHTIWELYSAEKPLPGTSDYMEYGKESQKNFGRPDFCGWSALGPISMAIESVLGIECDYPERKIIWHSNCIQEHGIKNLRFGPHLVNLTAQAVNSIGEIPQIEIDAPEKISVEFKRFQED